ncbi:hypothetical protein ACVILH_003413 [Bradyrhizobium sp. USDA 4353]
MLTRVRAEVVLATKKQAGARSPSSQLSEVHLTTK